MRIPCWLLPLLLLATAPAGATVLDLPAAADLMLRGDRDADFVGAGLARGDFDGDAIEDLAIGAAGGSPFRESRIRSGTVYLLFGGPDFATRVSGSLGTLANRIVGTQMGQALGENMAVGDFDGDGFDDLLLGAPWSTEGDSTLREGGAAYLVRGRPRGDFPPVLSVPDSADVTFLAPEGGVHLGEAVASGDWNGDGRADLAIGAMYGNGPEGVRPHAGTTYIYFGRSIRKVKKRVPIARNADLTIHGADRDDTSGRSLVFTDWNGDGREDLLMGAYNGDGPDNTRTNSGEAYLFFGGTKRGIKKKTADLGQSGVSLPIYGVSSLGAFGRASSAGDLDGDGLGDVVVSAYRAPEPENPERALAGTVDVIFGTREPTVSIDLGDTTRLAAADTTRLDVPDTTHFDPPDTTQLAAPDTTRLHILGAAYYDKTGRFLKTGDLNGDGREELLVGIPFGDVIDPTGASRLQCGLVGIVMGRPRADFPDSVDLATTPFEHVIQGARAEDQIPMGLEVLDIDDDGKMDVVIGAPFVRGTEDSTARRGGIYFLLGSSRSW